MDDPPPIMTVRQLADYLQVSPTTIYRWMEREPPALPGRKVGGTYRFRRAAIDALLHSISGLTGVLLLCR
jgi:excisionase family DNA binding protein